MANVRDHRQPEHDALAVVQVLGHQAEAVAVVLAAVRLAGARPARDTPKKHVPRMVAIAHQRRGGVLRSRAS